MTKTRLSRVTSDKPTRDARIREAITKFNALSPAEQEAILAEQAKSFVRGELAFSKDVRKTVNPDGSITYADYESYCND